MIVYLRTLHLTIPAGEHMHAGIMTSSTAHHCSKNLIDSNTTKAMISWKPNPEGSPWNCVSYLPETKFHQCTSCQEQASSKQHLIHLHPFHVGPHVHSSVLLTEKNVMKERNQMYLFVKQMMLNLDRRNRAGSRSAQCQYRLHGHWCRESDWLPLCWDYDWDNIKRKPSMESIYSVVLLPYFSG